MRLLIVYVIWILISGSTSLFANNLSSDTLIVEAVTDFTIDGKGSNPQWETTAWTSLNQIDSGVTGYDSRFKIMYSPKGIYVLFSGKDKKITSPYRNDFDDLYDADVFEVFFSSQSCFAFIF